MRILENAGWMGGQALVQRILGMLSGVVLARALGTEALGIFSVVNNTANSAYGIFRLSVDTAMQVSIAGAGGKPRAVATTVAAGALLLLTLGSLAAVAVLLGRGWLAESIYGDPALAPWMNFAAALVLLQFVAQLCYSTLAGLHRFPAYARTMMISAVLNLLLVAGAGYLLGLKAALAALVVTQVAVAAALLWHLRSALTEDGIAPARAAGGTGDEARSLVRLGLPFYLSGFVLVPIAYWLQGQLGRGAGIEALGLRRVQEALYGIITFLPHSISGVVVSSLAHIKSSAEDPDRFNRLSFLTMKIVWLLTLTVAVLAAAVMPWLVVLLYGREFTGAVFAAQVGCGVAVMAAVIQAATNSYAAEKRFDLLLWIGLLQGAVFLPCGTFLVRRYGLEGYVAAEGLAQLAVLLFVLARVGREGRRLGVPARGGWFGLAVTLPAFVLPFYLRESGPGAVAGYVGYALVALWIFDRYVFSAADRTLVMTALRDRFAGWRGTRP